MTSSLGEEDRTWGKHPEKCIQLAALAGVRGAKRAARVFVPRGGDSRRCGRLSFNSPG